MRKVGWQWKIILFLMFAGLFCPVKVHAEETGSYLSELSDEMDYGKLDTFLKDYGVEQVSFSGPSRPVPPHRSDLPPRTHVHIPS